MMEQRKSKTYKLKIPVEGESTIYFTIVGYPKPEAFFVNSKSMKSFQWITALMTSYSRQLKNGREINEIILDMKETFDPNGRYVIPDGSGVEAHSIVHHLGLILERHIKEN